MKGTRKRRGSVSAPPTEEINVDVKLRSFEKDSSTLAFLQKTLASNFIFQEVKGQDATALAQAFEHMDFPAGHTIMKQGDDGDYFYCLCSGTVDIFVTPKPGDEPKRVLTLTDSGYFGELALMYHCPRQNRRVTYHSFLREVPLLQNLQPDEVGKLADVLIQSNFNDSEYIITQGNTNAETFYILYEGRARAILDQDGGPSVEVKSYKRGDYFGELALIKNHPRAANVVADGPCVCVCLDRAAFVRLLGAQAESMQRRSAAEYSAQGAVVPKPPGPAPAQACPPLAPGSPPAPPTPSSPSPLLVRCTAAVRGIGEFVVAASHEPLYKLFLSLLIDALGLLSFLLPVLGELQDLFWAPLASLLVLYLYGNAQLAGFALIEEALPFTDFLPTASLAWLCEFSPLGAWLGLRPLRQGPNVQRIE